jgi:hypothetical protein
LSANLIYHSFVKEFHFLPDCSVEPERISGMIQRLIWQESGLRIRLPECPKHQIPMILLGHLGVQYVKPKAPLIMDTVSAVNNRGNILVREGIFRCAVPGCFYVEPTENSGTMTARC